MKQPDFPQKGSRDFSLIVSPCHAMTKYIDIMQVTPRASLKERANLLCEVIRENANVSRFPSYQVEAKPDFIIEERNPDMLDMSDEEMLIGIPEAAAIVDAFVEESNNNEDEIDEDEPGILLSIEDIGERAQADLLDLKAALHQGCSEIDVGVLFLEGPSASDRLACIADDLSKLPTKQVTRVLKSFLAADTTRMLQQDLALVGRHLFFAHIKHQTAVPGALFISCLSEFASKWPQVFAESFLLSSLMNLEHDPLVQTLNRSLKTFSANQSSQSAQVLLKNLLKLTRKDRIHDAQKFKIINSVLGFVEILLNNTSMIQQEILSDLCLLYSEYQLELSKSHIFAKVTLVGVKRVSELGNLKASISDVVDTMNHPMKNIIKKVAASKS